MEDAGLVGALLLLVVMEVESVLVLSLSLLRSSRVRRARLIQWRRWLLLLLLLFLLLRGVKGGWIPVLVEVRRKMSDLIFREWEGRVQENEKENFSTPTRLRRRLRLRLGA